MAGAQVEPAATTRPGNPTPPGNLNYSIRYSQFAEFGGDLGDTQDSTLSGSATYSNGKDRRPFTLQYGGGYTWTISGPAYVTGFFHHLLIAQGLDWNRWNLSLSDDVSYSPEAPMFGFTGIPGTGEPITEPISTPSSNESILTLNTHVVNNTASGALGRSLTNTIGLNCGGSYGLIRFPDSDGIDIDNLAGNCGVQWRQDARNTIMSSYQHSEFSYPDLDFSFRTNTVYLGFERVWNRKISSNISAGPQWSTSSMSDVVPSTVGVAINAGLNYQYARNSAAVSYSRGVSNGGGFLVGAETDTAFADYSRQLSGKATLGLVVSYVRTAQLQAAGVVTGKDGEIQLARQLGRYFSMFANYSVVAQSSSASLPGNALGQIYQMAGFGIGFSPRQERLRH